MKNTAQKKPVQNKETPQKKPVPQTAALPKKDKNPDAPTILGPTKARAGLKR